MNSENWKDVAIQFNGKQVKGRYDVAGGVVTVIAWNGIKQAQLGRSSAEKVAQMLLARIGVRSQLIWCPGPPRERRPGTA
jgi:hypothetical protein